MQQEQQAGITRQRNGRRVYGKVFALMYEGTLAGHWQAIVTMQQLVVLADADGIVDMTAEAIARRTTIPSKIINIGLKFLAEPDPHSRTPGEDGRRIVLIDEHRPWGWQIVNYAKYRNLKNAEEVRAQTRERVRRFREKRASNAAVTLGNAEKRHTDTDTDTRRNTVGLKPDVLAVLKFLNEKTGRNYEPGKANCDLIAARLKEGASVDDCRAVIAKKCREWAGDEKMDLYLRPKTLFNRTNFAQYKGELGAEQ